MPLTRLTQLTVQIDADALIDSGADTKDAELAIRLVKAANELQAAMDAAASAGLMIKPTFQRTEGHAADYGSGADSFICRIEILRKLI